jgi:hypothetical protein
MRAQTQDDNNQADVRRNSDGGPYGLDTCLEDFVWREEFPGDHVCVTGQTREQARGTTVWLILADCPFSDTTTQLFSARFAQPYVIG